MELQYFLALVAVQLSRWQVNGKFSKGTLNTQSTLSNWEFLDRFCFVSQKGRLRYEFLFPAVFEPQFLFLYYDSSAQWPAVYKTGKTCSQKQSVLNVDNNQVIALNSNPYYPKDGLNTYRYGGCNHFHRDNRLWFNCTDERRFLSYRERWWYLAMADCNSSKGLYLEYKLWMTNGEKEDFWFYQFSADEFYILATDISFLLLEVFTLVIAVTVALLLTARQMFHQTYKLFLASLILEILSLFSDCVAYGKYASNGIGLPSLKLMGEMSRAASKLAFLLLLILMGKGYTITRGRISLQGTWKIAFFITVYSLVYGTLFIWQARVFDPGEVLYVYDSPAGYGIMIMRVIGWIWFCYAVYFTLVHYPEKRGFYYCFSITFSIWFWMGPAVILLSNHLLQNWHREKVVNGVENVISFFGFATFLFITRPSAANRTFPYHVRTTQIDVVNDADDSDASTNLPHHTYELGPFPKDDIFTISGVRRVNTQTEMTVSFSKTGVYGSEADEQAVATDPLNKSFEDAPPTYEETVKYAMHAPPTLA